VRRTRAVLRERSQLHPQGLREAGGDAWRPVRRVRVARARLGLGRDLGSPRRSRRQHTGVPRAIRARRWNERSHAVEKRDSGQEALKLLSFWCFIDMCPSEQTPARV